MKNVFIIIGLFLSIITWFISSSCKTIYRHTEKPLEEKTQVTQKPQEVLAPKIEQKKSLTKESPQASSKMIEAQKKKDFCNKVNEKFSSFGWKKIICNPDRWKTYGYSNQGNPLFYQDFGFTSQNTSTPINLFLCGVHGDEATGVYLCFHLVRDILFDNPESIKNFRLIVAPIVNPDGFFAGTRHNGNGVDVNRNLPTKDWKRLALKVWKQYKNAPQKFPGKAPGSEPESKFQVFLIDKYKPDKIVSVHAPYGFLDFDGPGDRKYYNLVRVEQRAKFLALNIEANSKRFLKVVDFRFFPGSLGNYAGNERKIPTYTLELPSTKVSKAPFYWNRLQYALTRALEFRVYDGKEGNPFFRAQEILNIETKKQASHPNNIKKN